MLAPVDPRPYASPTDLVTAADVARWLEGLDDDDDAIPLRAQALRAKGDAETVAEWAGGLKPSRMTVEDAVPLLLRRLDRERRQACRRGALACWRRFACVARSWGERPLTRAAMRDCAWSPEWPFPAARVLAAQAMIQDLTRALAFRAAARAK